MHWQCFISWVACIVHITCNIKLATFYYHLYTQTTHHLSVVISIIRFVLCDVLQQLLSDRCVIQSWVTAPLLLLFFSSNFSHWRPSLSLPVTPSLSPPAKPGVQRHHVQEPAVSIAPQFTSDPNHAHSTHYAHGRHAPGALGAGRSQCAQHGRHASSPLRQILHVTLVRYDQLLSAPVHTLTQMHARRYTTLLSRCSPLCSKSNTYTRFSCLC